MRRRWRKSLTHKGDVAQFTHSVVAACFEVGNGTFNRENAGLRYAGRMGWILFDTILKYCLR